MWPLTSSHWLTLGPTAPSSPGMPGIPAAPSGPGSPWKTTHELKTSRSLCSFYRTCFKESLVVLPLVRAHQHPSVPVIQALQGNPGHPEKQQRKSPQLRILGFTGSYHVVIKLLQTVPQQNWMSPWSPHELLCFIMFTWDFNFFFKCNTLKGTMLHNEYFYFWYFKNILLVILLYKAGTLSIY